MYFMALGILRVLAQVSVLPEAVFVSDLAEAADARTSLGAAETAPDNVPSGFLTFTPNHGLSCLT